MNNKILYFGLLFLCLVGSERFARGEVRPMHVEWSYSGTAVQYILYKDGVQTCVSSDPGAMQMECSVEIGAAPMTFTLSAVDAAGVESPQSAPYTLVPPAIDPVTGNYIPQADFTGTATTGQAPLFVGFDASASWDLGGMIVGYEWDFGDGGAGTGKLIDYFFATPGTYTVTLTVTDDQGASAQKTATITVTAQPPLPNESPIAVIEATPLQAGTAQIRFDASASSDPDGTIGSYTWDFGDGDAAVGSQVDHEFLAAGDYTVVLTVTDNQGGSGQSQMIMTIVDSPKPANVLPVAHISSSTNTRLVHIEWAYTGADAGLAGFRFYQNSRLVCEIADPAARQADCTTHVDSGAVRFWITSYHQDGSESAASWTLPFDNTGLSEAAGDAPLPVHFTPGASADADGTITSYAWNFGDGESATGMETDHTFMVPGIYTVTLTVTDNSGGQALATTTVTVTGGRAPLATGASFATDQDKSVTATLSANDPDGEPLSFRITKAPALGTAIITDTAQGIFTYVPNPGASGDDSFSFMASDGRLDSNEAVVAIAIRKSNSAPTTTGQSLAVLEDGQASGTLGAADVDNDPMTFSLVDLPAHGAITIVDAHSGAFTYTPAANYNGSDSFTFKASDGKLDSGPATVSVTVAPVDDAPQASNLTLAASEDLVATGQLSGLDADGDALTFSIVTPGAHGSVVVSNPATGAYTYTPATNSSGQDSFVYRVSDGRSAAEATVSVTVAPVNDAPQASNLTLAATEDLVATGQLSGLDPEGDALTFSIVTPGAHGSVVVSNPATGAYTYTPATNSNGQDSFVYRVSDGRSAAEATVSVTVAPVDDAPQASNLTLAASEDLVATGQLSGLDADGDTLTFSIVTSGAHGSVVVSDPATGAYTYTPEANSNGQDSFVYRVSDGRSAAEATVSVTVAPVNDPPVATADAVQVKRGGSVLIPVRNNDSDPEDDPLTVLSVTNPRYSHGKATLINGEVTYTANKTYVGKVYITYTIGDGKGGTAIGKVTITVVR